MIRILLPLSLLVPAAMSATASAAERRPFVTSFDRVRIEGPFAVTIATGQSPGARVSGDAAALDTVEVRQDGATVVIRRQSGRWQESGQAVQTQPIAVTLGTPTLQSVSVLGTGVAAVTGMNGGRLDLSVAGTGSIAVADANGAQLKATTIGSGRIDVAGRADKVSLSVNGAGTIHADQLDATELTVRLDGPGEVTARARYTAAVTNTGLGRIAVMGTPKCQVRADAGGPVTCGAGAIR